MQYDKWVKTGDITTVHFIGVGGIGMSALARLCAHEGKKVTGSDVKQSDITHTLEKEGIHISYTQEAKNIPEQADLVIYTEAVDKKTNEEFITAKKRGVETINYFDALGLFLNDYYLIAIAGSHGKTTTTAMLTEIMEAAGMDPTAIVGSLRKKTNNNFRAGKSKYAIVEACEFRRDFLSLKPDVLIITNIEYEHVDYYKNLEDVQKAFHELAEQVSSDGVIIANTDDEKVATALAGVEGVQKIDYTQYFDPLFEKLSMPGVHNRMNAAAAIAAATYLGVDVYLAREALQNFEGTWRRFEYKGELNGAKVYDDYAHHPTEIKMTIKTTKELFPDKKLKVVFQPHTVSRLRTLFDDFAEELGKADEILLLPIYKAREADDKEVSSEKLQVKISGKNPDVQHFETHDAVVAYLNETITKDDVLLLMGAGDIFDIANTLTRK